MKRLNVLFVCSRNQWRSPTAEAVYRDDPRVSVRSRGTASAARRTVCSDDLAWANVVLVMEPQHRKRLVSAFPRLTMDLSIHVLDIPDDYAFMSPELVEQIKLSVEPIIAALLD